MQHNNFYQGQEVTWVKQWPYVPLHCRIATLYGREARIWYSRGHPFYDHKYEYVSVKKLLPGHIKGLNEEELKKLLNPKYKRKTKPQKDYDEIELGDE